jgi:hypothetical protein
MSEHAVLAPSSAYLRMACAGSLALEHAYPEPEDSQASREGTAAHWAAEELMRGRTIDVGLVAPNGVILDDEMVEAASMYASEVIYWVSQYMPGAQVHIEERVSCATIHPECWGTPDAWVYQPTKLKLWDFKYGHRYVEVFENEQLLEYVAGILDSLGIDGTLDQVTEVEMTIVQPRCYVGGEPIRTWRVMASNLRGYFNKLRNGEAAAMRPNAPCTPNPHCRDCRGAAGCSALQRVSYDAMATAAAPVPFNLPPQALGLELRYLHRAIASLQARATGLEEQALATIKRGTAVPFYRIEAGKGRERWSRPDAEIIAMGDMMGVDLRKSATITPKQAIKANMPEAVVKAFSETPTGELKLVQDDGTQARKVFS